ncbi:FecR family protein, partial [Bacteroides heparinolyticus]
MNNYIHKIIDFFFHHDVSDEMATRVYRRMVSPTEDKMREEAVARIWNKLNNASCPEEKIEKAFHQLESSIKDEKRTESVAAPKRKQILRRISPVRVAAFWTIPLIMACLSAYYYYSTQSYVAQKLSEVTYVQHYAAIGTRNEVLLPDGSKVCLNAGTLLIYPSTFASEARSVYLSGEAFFEVAKDKEHPFTVTTNHLTLKVLGTTFNVSAYPDNNQVMATLETGKLQVKVNEQPAEYFLEPND